MRTVILIACLVCVALSYPVHAVTCLSSAKAVWSEHHGAWATWKREHNGGKCWYARGEETKHVRIPVPKERPVLIPLHYDDPPQVTPAQLVEIAFKAMGATQWTQAYRFPEGAK